MARSHDVQALSGIDLRVERGTTLGLAGPSGCGKSTLARCLAGLEPLDAGKVLIDGHDITALRGRALLPYRNQVQLIFQDSAAALNPRFTALDIVTEPMVDPARWPRRPSAGFERSSCCRTSACRPID